MQTLDMDAHLAYVRSFHSPWLRSLDAYGWDISHVLMAGISRM